MSVHAVGNKEVKIENLTSGLPMLKLDEARIHQVFQNVVGNAIKFTKKGTITISNRISDDWIEISISDTGCGIPEESYELIFEDFKQLDASSVREVGGTGLGLSISKRIMELHEGAIVVRSEGAGKGSTFSLIFPKRLVVPSDSVDTTKVFYSPPSANPWRKSPELHKPQEVHRKEKKRKGLEGTEIDMENDLTLDEPRRTERKEIWDKNCENTRNWKFCPDKNPDVKLEENQKMESNNTGANSAADGKVVDRKEDEMTSSNESFGRNSPARKLSVDSMTDSPRLAENNGIRKIGRRISVEVIDGESSSSEKNGKHAKPPAIPEKEAKPTVLSVDDDVTNQKVITKLLRDSYNVVTAMNGPDALSICERSPPDVILLDWMMPLMSGLEVCKELRTKFSMCELPIILISAKNRPDQIAEGLGTGANDYIAKPVNKQELLARMRVHLSIIEIYKQQQPPPLQLEKKNNNKKN